MDVTGVEGFREIACLEVWVKVGRLQLKPVCLVS